MVLLRDGVMLVASEEWMNKLFLVGLLAMTGGDAWAQNWPCADDHIDVELNRAYRVVGGNNDFFDGHFTGVHWDERKEIYAAVPDRPLPGNVRHVVVLAAGQQGTDFATSLFQNGFDNTATGQRAGYKSGLGMFGIEEVRRCGLYGRIVEGSNNQALPFDLRGGDRDTLVVLLFDTAFYHGLSTTKKSTMVDAYQTWLTSMFDPSLVEDITMVGVSRGGALTYRLAEAFRDDNDLDGVRIHWGGLDAVLNSTQGEGDSASWTLDNPAAPTSTVADSCPLSGNVAPAEFVARSTDVSDFFSDTEDLRLFQIVGGAPVGPSAINAMGVSPSRQRDAMFYKQEWVGHDHCEIGRLVGPPTVDDTLVPMLDWMVQVFDEEPDDSWKISSGGDGPFVAWDTGLGHLRADDLLFGDFNGDGDADVLYPSGSSVYGLRRAVSYSNTIGMLNVFSTGTDASHSASHYAIGDFDGDGKDDIFLANGTQWKIKFSGQSSFTFARLSDIPIEELGFGDLDGDGDTDVVHFTGNSTTGWDLYRSHGNRSIPLFASAYDLRSGPYSNQDGGLFVGSDFDNDGRDDIVFVPLDNDNEQVEIFFPYTSRGGLKTVRKTSTLSGLQLPRIDDLSTRDRVTVGDFDGDGYGDLLVATGRGFELATAEGRNGLGPLRLWSERGGSYHAHMAMYGVGDFDRDGADDLFLSQ